MEEKNKILSIIYDPKIMRFESYIGLVILINNLYKSMGGDGLEIVNTKSFNIVKESESPYELFSNTEFANNRSAAKETIPHYIPRPQVYEAINKYAINPNDAERLNKEVDNRFPKDRWGDDIPYNKALVLLMNDNLESLVFRE